MGKNNTKKYILPVMLIVTFFCMYAKRAWFKIGDGNIAVVASSYKNGFCSAGLMGTIYRGINRLVPIDMMSYEPYYFFSKYMCILYLLIAGIFLLVAANKVNETYKEYAGDFFVLLVIVMGGMFVTGDTMGSFDMYLSIVAFCCLILIFTRKLEFLVILLSAVGVLIHPSFVFKFLPLLLLCWIYRVQKMHMDSYKKYIVLTLVITILIWGASEISALRATGLYEQAKTLGLLLSRVPEEYDAVFAERAMREVSSLLPEWGYHGNNYINLLVLFLVASPYLLIGHVFFECFKSRVRTDDNYKLYRVIQLGGLFLLPQMMMKIKYGYFIYEILVYYLVMMMFLFTEEDKNVITQVKETREAVRQRVPASAVLLVYPLLFMPFSDVSILNGLDTIARIFGA